MCGSHIFLIAMRGIKILWVVSIFFSFNAQLFWTYTRCTDYLMSCLTGVFVFLHVFLPATILRMHAARQSHSRPCQTAIESNFDGLQGFQPSKFLIVHSIILYVKKLHGR